MVIIEDVTTSGKSIEETFPIIRAQGKVEIVGLMVSLNRMERGKGDKSALEAVSYTHLSCRRFRLVRRELYEKSIT